MTATRKFTTALFGTIAGAVAFVAIAMQGVGADDTHWNLRADTHWSISQDADPDDTHWSTTGDDDPAPGDDNDDTDDTHW